MEELKKRKRMRYVHADYNAVGVYFITVCTKDRKRILSDIVGTGVLARSDSDGIALASGPRIEIPVGTGVPVRSDSDGIALASGPQTETPVGTGVLDGPQTEIPGGTGVLDGPQTEIPVGTGVLARTDNGEIALASGVQIKLKEHGIIAEKYLKQMNDFYKHISVEKYVIMPNHIHLLLFVKPNNNGPSGTPVPTVQNSTVSKFISTFKRFCNKEYGENVWQNRSYDHIIRNSEDYERHLGYIYENPLGWYYDELYSEE